MGNVIQRLTRRSGDFQLTQQGSNETKQKTAPPTITVNDVNSADDQEDIIEENEGENLVSIISPLIDFFVYEMCSHIYK